MRGLLALSLALPASAEPLFVPKETVAVVAGVLEWEHKGFEPYPKEKRKDAELYAVLGSLGVERRTLLLDEQATRPAVLGALREAVAASGPETTLLFYFAGHGVKGKDGSIAFASREMDPWKHETGLRLAELTRLFADGGKRLFRGKRVVLLADCCHSGGLAETAKALSDAGIEAVALTSADASNVSTGNWTFTRTVLEALRGGARCDVDRDGAVTLAELAEEARLAMKHREGQRYGYANHGVPPAAEVSKAAVEEGERESRAGRSRRATGARSRRACWPSRRTARAWPSTATRTRRSPGCRARPSSRTSRRPIPSAPGSAWSGTASITRRRC